MFYDTEGDNYYRIDGKLKHEHQSKRGGWLREQYFESKKLGLKGKIDLLENDMVPVERKRGDRYYTNDEIQLAGYCMLLEENIDEDIEKGIIYLYGTDQRHEIEITEWHRQKVKECVKAMRNMSPDDPPPFPDNPNKWKKSSVKSYGMPYESWKLGEEAMSEETEEQLDENDEELRAAEALPDNSVIYVREQGTQVGINEGRIEVRKEGDVIASYPEEQVNTLNLFGGVNFTTPFIKDCNRKEITVNYFTIHGSYEGSFIPEHNTIARVRRKQYALDDDTKRDIVEKMVYGKTRNMKTILMRKGVKDVAKLGTVLDQLDEHTYEIDTLRAREGEATDYYFQQLDETLREGWTFEKRTRRPPEDHINSLLSLTYTFLKNEVLSGLRQYNLDPFLGVMHVDRHGRPSLALDLMEEFRPLFADSFAIRLINRRTLRHSDFRKNNRLEEGAMKQFMDKWEDYMNEEFRHPLFEYQTSRRKAIQMQAILLRKVITGENDEYHPLVFKR
jgi:CRISPR-associated protein Cas1